MRNSDCVLLKCKDFNGIKFARLFCQVHLSCFSSQLCQIVKSTLLTFGYFVKGPLPICWMDFAKLQSSHYWVCFPSSQLPNSTMLPNCQVHFPQWTAQMSIKLPNNLGCVTDFSLPVCQNFCSKKPESPWFPPSPPPHFLTTLSLSLF
jgi:hypothetical protein